MNSINELHKDNISNAMECDMRLLALTARQCRNYYGDDCGYSDVIEQLERAMAEHRTRIEQRHSRERLFRAVDAADSNPEPYGGER